MGASVRPDPMDAALAEIRAQQSKPDPMDAALAEIRASAPQRPSVPRTVADASSALPRNRENASGDFGVLGRGVAANLLNAAQGIPGMEAFEAGAGALGSRFTDHPLSYRESLDALRSQTDPIPGIISLPEKLLGGGAIASALPAKTIMQATKSGALLGGADQALSADPDESLASRATKTGLAAAAGGAIGGGLATAGKVVNKVNELKPLARRVMQATMPDELAVVNAKMDKAANTENYATAARQADAVGGTTPGIRDVLESPDVKPYADMVRGTKAGANADDAAVLRMVRKVVSKERQSAVTKNKIPGEYDPKSDLRAGDLRDMLQRLDAAASSPSQKPPLTLDIAPEVYERDAKVVLPEREPMAGPITPGLAKDVTEAPNPSLSQALRNFSGDRENAVAGPKGPGFQLGRQTEVVQPGVRVESPGMTVQTAPAEDVPAAMPSLPDAISARARMGKDRDAFNTAVGMTRRIASGKLTPVKQLEDKSPAAWLDQILGYSPSELERATAGTLGAAKEGMSIHAPTSVGSLLNLGRPVTRLNRIAPFVRALDEQAGRSVVNPREWEDVLRAIGVLNAPVANPTP